MNGVLGVIEEIMMTPGEVAGEKTAKAETTAEAVGVVGLL
jgi:hypothetical protein